MKNNPLSKMIRAVVVNHNTSDYTELLLRSMFAMHTGALDISVTVYDNDSQDNRSGLEAFAQAKRIPILSSGFDTHTKWNSHGEVLSRFVLENSDCAYLLFLDADACFLEENTLDRMLRELQNEPLAFGINPRIASNAECEIAEAYWPVVYQTRLHPCCALVKNSEIFHTVVAEVGLSCMQYLWARGEEYFDTFRLMTQVMKTHGFHVTRSAAMIQHFFCVSYAWDPPEVMNYKAQLRETLLERYRQMDREQ